MEKKLLIEVEAEKSVLAAAILDPSVFPAARGILRPTDFGRSAHQVIWKAMEGIADQGEPIDQLTLKHFLTPTAPLSRSGARLTSSISPPARSLSPTGQAMPAS